MAEWTTEYNEKMMKEMAVKAAAALEDEAVADRPNGAPPLGHISPWLNESQRGGKFMTFGGCPKN